MPSNYQDIEILLKEAGVDQKEAQALVADLSTELGNQPPREEFRQELKQRLLAEAGQKPAVKFMARFSPKRNKYAGIAAAILILVVGASVSLNLGLKGPNGLDPETGGTMNIMTSPVNESDMEAAEARSTGEAPDANSQEDQALTASQNPDQPVDNQTPDSAGENGSVGGKTGSEAILVDREKAIQLAKDYVTYPTRVLEASLKQIDGQDYWTVSLSREGAGIPNRDDFLVHAQSGEVIHTMSAQ